MFKNMSKPKIFICVIVGLIVFSMLSCCFLGGIVDDDTLKSETGITNFLIDDISNQEFYTGITSDEIKVIISASEEYDENDINVIIDDPQIAEIEFQKNDSYTSPGLIFTIKGLVAGSTKFHFETSDGIIKSNEVDLTIIQNIKEIKFDSTENVTFDSWQDTETLFFTISSNDSNYDLTESIEFVSENPEIVTVEYDTDSLLYKKCILTNISAGETYIYIQTKDKSVVSEKIKVIVNAEEIETTVPVTEEQTYPQATEATQSTINNEPEPDNSYQNEYDEPTESYNEPTEEIKSGPTVYITPTGKKYHYSSSCAGPNAMARDLDSVSGSYGPCKKCAQ